jgi:hypothetical protein
MRAHSICIPERTAHGEATLAWNKCLLFLQFQFFDRTPSNSVLLLSKGHRKMRLREKVGSPEFHRAYQAAVAAIGGTDQTSKAKPKAPTPNSFQWLCLKFFDSTDFKLLDPTTQHVRKQVLEHTWDEPIAPGAIEKFGDFPLSRMNGKAVRVLRNRKAEFPEAANVRIKAVRRVPPPTAATFPSIDFIE